MFVKSADSLNSPSLSEPFPARHRSSNASSTSARAASCCPTSPRRRNWIRCKRPSRGTRRPGGIGNYWMRDVHYETWKHDFEDHFTVIPQIESQAGVANVDVIGAHPLVRRSDWGRMTCPPISDAVGTPMPPRSNPFWKSRRTPRMQSVKRFGPAPTRPNYWPKATPSFGSARSAACWAKPSPKRSSH